jgi:hypothetical protein
MRTVSTGSDRPDPDDAELRGSAWRTVLAGIALALLPVGDDSKTGDEIYS